MQMSVYMNLVFFLIEVSLTVSVALVLGVPHSGWASPRLLLPSVTAQRYCTTLTALPVLCSSSRELFVPELEA